MLENQLKLREKNTLTKEELDSPTLFLKSRFAIWTLILTGAGVGIYRYAIIKMINMELNRVLCGLFCDEYNKPPVSEFDRVSDDSRKIFVFDDTQKSSFEKDLANSQIWVENDDGEGEGSYVELSGPVLKIPGTETEIRIDNGTDLIQWSWKESNKFNSNDGGNFENEKEKVGVLQMESSNSIFPVVSRFLDKDYINIEEYKYINFLWKIKSVQSTNVTTKRKIAGKNYTPCYIIIGSIDKVSAYHKGTFIRLIHKDEGKIGTIYKNPQELTASLEKNPNAGVLDKVVGFFTSLGLPKTINIENIYDVIVSNKDSKMIEDGWFDISVNIEDIVDKLKLDIKKKINLYSLGSSTVGVDESSTVLYRDIGMNAEPSFINNVVNKSDLVYEK